MDCIRSAGIDISTLIRLFILLKQAPGYASSLRICYQIHSGNHGVLERRLADFLQGSSTVARQAPFIMTTSSTSDIIKHGTCRILHA